MFFQREVQMVMIVLVHIDECMIVVTAIMLIDHFKKKVAKHVEIINLRELHCTGC
jgi:hypothetical protein